MVIWPRVLYFYYRWPRENTSFFLLFFFISSEGAPETCAKCRQIFIANLIRKPIIIYVRTMLSLRCFLAISVIAFLCIFSILSLPIFFMDEIGIGFVTQIQVVALNGIYNVKWSCDNIRMIMINRIYKIYFSLQYIVMEKLFWHVQITRFYLGICILKSSNSG